MPMADIPWTGFMDAVRAAGFVTLAQSRAFVVLGRAGRSATIRRIPLLDEPMLRAVLLSLGLERATFLSCLAREPPDLALSRTRGPTAERSR